jgi:Transposase DDE domain
MASNPWDRRDRGAGKGVTKQVLAHSLAAYDRMLGLDLEDLAVDASITKSPCGGEVSGPSPVDRGKQGTKRSVVVDGSGIPLHLVAAAANSHDSPLLEPTLAGVPDAVGPLPEGPCVHLDAGSDSGKTLTCCRLWATPTVSPPRERPPRSRPASVGPSSARTRG